MASTMCALLAAAQGGRGLQVHAGGEEPIGAGDHDRAGLAARELLAHLVALRQQVEVEGVRGRAVDADDRDVARLLDVNVLWQRWQGTAARR